MGQPCRRDAGKVAPPLEYVGAVWVAKRIGITQQSVSKTGKAMLKPGYRGQQTKVPYPDAVDEGRPLWLKSRFDGDVDA